MTSTPRHPFDPLSVLRDDGTPVAPDPGFAERLRVRLERALSDPEDPMTVDLEQPAPVTGRAAGAARITPYLAVADARAALQWYTDALGATVVGEPVVMPDARIGHAEFEVVGARIFLSDAHPEIGVDAPVPGAGATVTLHLELAEARDVDRLVDRAEARGAVVERPPADSPYGRQAVIRDPAGHRWMFMAVPAPAVAVPLSPGDDPIREGDAVHASIWTRDPRRARAFYRTVLGWEVSSYDPARQQVVGQGMTLSIAPTDGEPTLFCSYAVDDIAAAIERVRAAGGSADEPSDMPWGRSTMCADPSGRAFGLWENNGQRPRPPVNGNRQGDLAYITMGVPGDSAVARDFYRRVLGWEFAPGHIDDGWQVTDTAPMTGLAGGQDSAVTSPMWLVNDIEAAVRRVRAAGGRATDPERQPYGISSECVDDQGMRFYLGEL